MVTKMKYSIKKINIILAIASLIFCLIYFLFSGRTIAHWSAKKGMLPLLSLYSFFHIPLDRQDHDGCTPLMICSEYGNNRCITFLIDHGADINARTYSGGLMPLHFAAIEDQPSSIDILVKRGADVNCRSFKGTTPLMLAAKWGAIESCKKLMALGTDINMVDYHGNPASFYAARYKQTAVCKMLLQSSKTHLTVQNNKRINILEIAVANRNAELTQYLITIGANANNIDQNGNSPLMLACREDDFIIASMLILHGAKVNVINNDGLSPLHYAATNDNINIALLLIRSGANTSVRNARGQTPSQLASESGNNKLAEIIK